MAEELNSILSKYRDQEVKINEKLSEKKGETVHKQSEYKKAKRVNRVQDMERAICRNKQILQDLETTKGFLRSKAIFSPSEMVFGDICRKYKEAPSLQVTTWRCHLPVFV